MFWGLILDASGVFQNVCGLERKMMKNVLQGRFVEGPEAAKKGGLLAFLQCFIAFNRKAAFMI